MFRVNKKCSIRFDKKIILQVEKSAGEKISCVGHSHKKQQQQQQQQQPSRWNLNLNFLHL